MKTCEMLGVLEKEPDEYYDLKGSLRKLKDKWVQQLQLFARMEYQMKISKS